MKAFAGTFEVQDPSWATPEPCQSADCKGGSHSKLVHSCFDLLLCGQVNHWQFLDGRDEG